jgi:soluble lytic murein transglycosylase
MAIISNHKKRLFSFTLLGFFIILIITFSLVFYFLNRGRISFSRKTKRVKTYSLSYKTHYYAIDFSKDFNNFFSSFKKGKIKKAKKLLDKIDFPAFLNDYKSLLYLKLYKKGNYTYRALQICKNKKQYYFSPFYPRIVKNCIELFREKRYWKLTDKTFKENEIILLKNFPAFTLFLKGELYYKYLKDKNKGNYYYKRLMILFPFSEYANTARKTKTGLLSKFSTKEKLERIENLIRHRRYGKAKRELLKLKKSDKRDFFIGLTYYKRGAYNYSKRWFLNVNLNSKIGAEAAKYILRISYKRRGLENLKEIYYSLLRKGAAKKKLSLIMGDFNFSKLNLGEAKKFYESYLSNNKKPKKEIMRRVAWINYFMGNIKKTYEYYKKIEEPLISEKYWQLRLKEKIYGKSKKLKQEYFEFVKDNYYHYYGGLARRELSGKRLKQIDGLTERRASDIPYTPFFLRELKRIDFFAINNLRKGYKTEIKALSQLYSAEETKYYILDKYYETHDFYFVIVNRVKLYNPFSITTPVKYLIIAYPFHEKYFDLIKRESGKYNIDHLLVLSLIRQESLFNKGALSYAGARGLMQIMYYTARRLAREAQFRGLRKQHLYNPDINIKLGVFYLKKLYKLYGKKNHHLVLAAYNAGEHRVNYWKTVFKDFSKDEFVEMIPFTQTRKYVKIILTNYNIYKRLKDAQEN